MSQGYLRANRRWTMADVVAVQARMEQPVVVPLQPKPAKVERPRNFAPFGGFSFRLPWAPSVNRAYTNKTGSDGRTKSSRARRYGEAVMTELMAQRVPCEYLAHPLSIWIVQHASADRGDPDNGQKIVLDCMVRYGVIADDNRGIVKDLRVTDSTRVPQGEEYIEVHVSCLTSR
jgi:Holliday junction resolvase RusA-like endonuclease